MCSTLYELLKPVSHSASLGQLLLLLFAAAACRPFCDAHAEPCCLQIRLHVQAPPGQQSGLKVLVYTAEGGPILHIPW